MHYLKTYTLYANVRKRQTKKALVAVDILRMYMYALGCQMIEKFSIFDISKLSPQKTVLKGLKMEALYIMKLL